MKFGDCINEFLTLGERVGKKHVPPKGASIKKHKLVDETSERQASKENQIKHKEARAKRMQRLKQVRGAYEKKKIHCAHCGKEMAQNVSGYCRDCLKAGKVPTEPRTCAYCGNAFLPPTPFYTGLYCREACRVTARRVRQRAQYEKKTGKQSRVTKEKPVIPTVEPQKFNNNDPVSDRLQILSNYGYVILSCSNITHCWRAQMTIENMEINTVLQHKDASSSVNELYSRVMEVYK